MRREQRLRSANPRMVGSWSPQSLSSMLMVRSISSGFAAAHVVIYWYSDFLRTTSCESDAAQLITCSGGGWDQTAGLFGDTILLSESCRLTLPGRKGGLDEV